MATPTLWITFFSILVCAFATTTQEVRFSEWLFKNVGPAEDEKIAVVATKEDIAMDEYGNKRRELEGKYNNQKRMLDDWFKVSSNILKRSYRIKDEGLYQVLSDPLKKVLINLDAAAIAKCVANTNMYRQKHKNTPDLVWDADIAEGAQKWAAHLLSESLKQNKFVFDHALGNGLGENMYWNIGAGDCSAANKVWYSEVKDYSFANNRPKTGKMFYSISHFSQLVWKGTTKFGVGIAKGNFGVYYNKYKLPQYYVVARYSPPGNYRNRFKSNVMPLV